MTTVIQKPFGVLADRSRLVALAFAIGIDNSLVFMQAHGPSTLIEQIDAEIKGRGEPYISCSPFESLRAARRFAIARKNEDGKCAYTTHKTPIPSTTDLNYIAVHKSVQNRIAEDRPHSFALFEDEADLKLRLWHHVHRLVYVPLSDTPEARDYLFKRGKLENLYTVGITIEESIGNRDLRGWFSANVNSVSFSNDREQWHSLISAGVRNRLMPL